MPTTTMAKWKGILTEDKVQAVYGYVRSLRASASSGAVVAIDGIYACPMHPQVTSDAPGKCSICGMKLVIKKSPHDHEGHAH